MVPTNLVPDLCSSSSTSAYDRSNYSFDDNSTIGFDHKSVSFTTQSSGCSVDTKIKAQKPSMTTS